MNSKMLTVRFITFLELYQSNIHRNFCSLMLSNVKYKHFLTLRDGFSDPKVSKELRRKKKRKEKRKSQFDRKALLFCYIFDNRLRP